MLGLERESKDAVFPAHPRSGLPDRCGLPGPPTAVSDIPFKELLDRDGSRESYVPSTAQSQLRTDNRLFIGFQLDRESLDKESNGFPIDLSFSIVVMRG